MDIFSFSKKSRKTDISRKKSWIKVNFAETVSSVHDIMAITVFLFAFTSSLLYFMLSRACITMSVYNFILSW